MYYRFFLIFFINFITLDSLSANTIDVSKINTYTQVSDNIKIFHDKNERFSIETLPTNNFRNIKNLGLGYIDGAIWTKFDITNSSKTKQTILLINPKVNINKIDVYVFRKNTLLKNIELGNHRSLQNNHIKSKFSNFELTLYNNETLTIISRLKSQSTIDANWYISNTNSFLSFLIYDTFFWGILAGLVLSLIIYNFSIFRTLKDYSYLAYIFHGFFALMFQYSTNGVFYQFELYENTHIFNSVAWINITLNFISILLFVMFFFNTKKNLQMIHKILLLLIIYNATILLIFIFSFYYPDMIFVIRDITKPIALAIVLFLLFVGFLAWKKNISGSIYYILGHGIFLTTLLIQQFSGIINFQTNFINIYIVALGLLADVVFLSLALSEKLHKIKLENEKNEIMLISQSNFSTIGKTVGNLAHQWKVPIVQLSSLVMQIESILWNKKSSLVDQLNPILAKIKNTIDFMNNTVLEFNNFYANASKNSFFNPAEEIQNVINLISAKMLYVNTNIELNIDKDVQLNSNKNAFANCCLIIIDNALDEIRKRLVKNGKINITLKQTQSDILLQIRDNAGGITIDPIDDIFELFNTDKQNGSGMGLSMCKMLVESKLNGKIKAYNTPTGACFEIILPIK